MEGLIASSAYLWICPDCGGHARIVFTNGMATPDFVLKETGYIFLRAACRKKDYLTEEETKAVKEQIETSCLRKVGLTQEDILRGLGLRCDRDDFLDELMDRMEPFEKLGMGDEMVH